LALEVTKDIAESSVLAMGKVMGE